MKGSKWNLWMWNANRLRDLPLSGMKVLQKNRARQPAFMLTMHTKDRALQMITKLIDAANGFEIWRRFLEKWEPAHRRRYRAMLMQLLQVQFTGDRGQAFEWERLVRQYEAQSSDTLKDTSKAAILSIPSSMRLHQGVCSCLARTRTFSRTLMMASRPYEMATQLGLCMIHQQRGNDIWRAKDVPNPSSARPTKEGTSLANQNTVSTPACQTVCLSRLV